MTSDKKNDSIKYRSLKQRIILPISVKHACVERYIFHVDFLISLKFPMVRLIKPPTFVSHCVPLDPRYRLAMLLVFKRKRMKRKLRLYRDEKTLLSPCLSLSPALCVLLVRRVACVHPFLIVGKLPSISMSLSFGILASVAPLSSCGCLSLPTATRRTRSPVRVRFCRCLGDLPGMHTASGVYTSTVFTHACTHSRSCSNNSSHSSGKTLRFECDKRTGSP